MGITSHSRTRKTCAFGQRKAASGSWSATISWPIVAANLTLPASSATSGLEQNGQETKRDREQLSQRMPSMDGRPAYRLATGAILALRATNKQFSSGET